MSNPSGALVTAGGRSCTTPCYLDVPIHTKKAVFTHYSAVQEEVSIEHLTSRSASAKHGAEKAGEYTLETLGLTLGGIGLLAFALAESYQTDAIQTEQHSSRDETIFWIVAATGIVSGSLLIFLGKKMSDNAKNVEPEVYAELNKPQPFPLSDMTSTQPNLQNGEGKLYSIVPPTQKPVTPSNKATDFFKQ